MAKRKPQINFQVDEPMKDLYDEAKASGHWVTRFCAAGFLLMVEDAAARARAISRLRDWEAEYDGASQAEIRAFVEGAQDAMRRASRGSRPARSTRHSQKKAKR
jgi:hypothetical protein